MELNLNYNMDFRKKKESIYRLALFIGELLLKNGVETYRVEILCREFCTSKGFRNTSLLVTPTLIIIGDDRDDGITFMKTIKNRTINLNKCTLLNSLTLKLISQKEIDIEKSIKLLKKIEKKEIYSFFTKAVFAGLGSGTFSLLFKTNLLEFFFTFIIVILSLYIFKKIIDFSMTSMIGIIVSTFFIGISAQFLNFLGLAPNSNFIIVGGIIPFLPGIAITKGISDLVYGDLMSGNTRATEAFLTALSIGIGVGGAIKIWIKLGGQI